MSSSFPLDEPTISTSIFIDEVLSGEYSDSEFEIIYSSVYIDVTPDTPVTIDDVTYPDPDLGKANLLKSKFRQNLKPYTRCVNKMTNYTWGTLLLSGNVRDMFEELPIRSIKPSIPSSFKAKLSKKTQINKIGIFKYDKGLRFGGVLSITGIFYVFWIDHKKNDIYNHTS